MPFVFIRKKRSDQQHENSTEQSLGLQVPARYVEGIQQICVRRRRVSKGFLVGHRSRAQPPVKD